VSDETVSIDHLAVMFANARKAIDIEQAKVVKRTAHLIAATQRATVAKRSRRTSRSIKVTGPKGRRLGPTSLEAEIGPTHFVARFLEFGTVKMLPRPFVAASADPHMERHCREMADAAVQALEAKPT
jgi:HK97 gp10 family phage protein